MPIGARRAANLRFSHISWRTCVSLAQGRPIVVGDNNKKEGTMTLPERSRQLAALIERVCADIPRAQLAAHEGPIPYRPSDQEIARRFLAEAEFEALGLGRVLGGPDGEVIQAGVALVFPGYAAADAALIIRGLTLAANAQSRWNRLVTGAGLSLAAIGVGKLIVDVMKRAA
jgi:hypothetical protein